MLDQIEIITAALLLINAAKAIRLLALGCVHPLLFVFPIHAGLCGLPLVADQLIGLPNLPRFPGFMEANESSDARLVYCAYVLFCPLFWWLFFPRKNQLSNYRLNTPTLEAPKKQENKRWVRAAFVIMLLPLAVTAFSPEPEMYLQYTPFARELSTRTEQTLFIHMILNFSIQAALLAGSYVLITTSCWQNALITVMPLFTLYSWLCGKRNVVAMAAVLTLSALWYRGVLRGRRLVITACFLVSLFVVYSVAYQSMWRFSQEHANSYTLTDTIDGARIDYGRDQAIRLNLFLLLNPQREQILEYTGQSLVAYATVFIPRRYWPEKSQHYSFYLTRAAMRDTWYWGGLTTSILEEAIANFGWAGILLGPLAIVIICLAAAKKDSSLVLVLTVIIIVAAQTVHFPAWAPLAAVWLAAIIFSRDRILLRSNLRSDCYTSELLPAHRILRCGRQLDHKRYR